MYKQVVLLCIVDAMEKDDSQIVELAINHIADMGDGVAKYYGRNIFIPMSCPGDIVKAKIFDNGKNPIKTNFLDLVKPSSERQKPACKHFGECGGCSAQHLGVQIYKNFKQNILNNIIKDLGVDDNVVESIFEVGKYSRRRAEFKVSISKGKVAIGFFANKSHDIVDLKECPVSQKELTNILPGLKLCIENLKKPGAIKAISITIIDNGLDIFIISNKNINENDKNILKSFAKENRVIRLSQYIKKAGAGSSSDSHASLIYDCNNSTVNFSGIDVEIPIGAFLQATKKGEDAITEFVKNNLEGCNNIADLYSGCGTYSFPLAKEAKMVAAYEGSDEMVSAMHNAIARNNLTARIAATSRDLFKNPLSDNDLNNFDGIVINPPRNGALPQVKNIAKSMVDKLVMVSCNPATFKRDAKYLLENNYKLIKAMPIDQFFWSRHLEVVAFFSR